MSAIGRFFDLLRKWFANQKWKVRTYKTSPDIPISCIERIKAVSNYFSPKEYYIYGLSQKPYSNYLREKERFDYRKSVSKKSVILDNKILFSQLIKNIIKTNEIFAYKMKGNYVILHEGFDLIYFIERLQENKRIVFKLQSGPGGGAGFILLEYLDGVFYINKKPSTSENIMKILIESDNYLLESFCEQNEFENTIFPDSVNTIRIVTALQKSGQIDVLIAMQRMGAHKGSCVDNAGAGGLFSYVDIETGTLSAAYSENINLGFNKDGSIKSYTHHPVTGAMIEGQTVPCWIEILRQVKDLHRQLLYTQLEFIAWDVALTNEGICIIEGNTSCSYDFIQVFRGQRDQPLGKWMKDYNYIK